MAESGEQRASEAGSQRCECDVCGREFPAAKKSPYCGERCRTRARLGRLRIKPIGAKLADGFRLLDDDYGTRNGDDGATMERW